MPVHISIRKDDNPRRRNVSRSLEFSDNTSLPDMIGAIDGLIRQCFPDAMRYRSINLSRQTNGRDRDVAHPPQETAADLQPGRNINRFRNLYEADEQYTPAGAVGQWQSINFNENSGLDAAIESLDSLITSNIIPPSPPQPRRR